VAFTVSLAPSAWAQLPVFAEPPPEPEPGPPPAAVEPVPPPAATEAPPPAATEAPLPPPPPPPAPAASPAPSAASSAPPPARTDHLASQGAQLPAREEEEVDDADLRRPRRSWYGWQTLTADGASMLLLLAGAATASSDAAGDSGDTMVTMGLVGYEFAPGIIHFAHGNPGRGFASFGIRLGMPIAGIILGAASASGCDGFECEAGGAALGLLLGMGGAMALDAAVFAYDDPERASDAARVLPLVGVTSSAAWIGLGGRL
jgi:hypothetical protein